MLCRTRRARLCGAALPNTAAPRSLLCCSCLFPGKALNEHRAFLRRYLEFSLRRIGQVEVVAAADGPFIPVARNGRLPFETDIHARGIVHDKAPALLQRVPVLAETGRIFIRDEHFLFVRRRVDCRPRHNARICPRRIAVDIVVDGVQRGILCKPDVLFLIADMVVPAPALGLDGEVGGFLLCLTYRRTAPLKHMVRAPASFARMSAHSMFSLVSSLPSI